MHRLLSLTILTVFIAAPTLAQQAPPARVGRVSFVSGNLAFHTAGQTEWSAAAVNYPVATGGSLWTDADSRAEIRIAPNTIDMAGNTELDVAELDERVTRLGVPQGRINLHLRHLDQGQSFEIDIPRGAVQLLQPGYYDIDAGTQDQPARVAVFEGSAQFIGGGTDIPIKAGDVATLNGLSPVTASFEPAVADAFVDWCRSRDYDEKRLAAPYHVSPNMTGYVELDEHGRWDSAPGYGEVWYPNVAPGWAPYTNGRWVWVAPWGWTWVDAEPWGFAPCHYGRWALIGDSWGWVPGAIEPSPVYAPALVAFVGGPGVGLYVSGAVGPQVGWFPLAPGEAYWPSYTADPSYIRSINRGSVGNIDNIQMMRNVMLPAQIANAQFANRRFATVVPQHIFAGAGNVASAALHPASSVVEHTPVTMRPPQVTPPPARSLPGPVAMGMRGRQGQGPVAGARIEPAGGGLAAASGAAAQPPVPVPTYRGPQAGPPTSSARLAPPFHPGVASPQGETAAAPQSFPGRDTRPASPDVTHLRAPAQAPDPPAQTFQPSAQAPHPVQAFHPPPQAPRPAPAFHPPAPTPQPAQAFHPAAQVPRAPAPAPQQVAHAPPAARGGGAAPQAPKGGGPAQAAGGGGKGDKHE